MVKHLVNAKPKCADISFYDSTCDVSRGLIFGGRLFECALFELRYHSRDDLVGLPEQTDAVTAGSVLPERPRASLPYHLGLWRAKGQMSDTGHLS